MLEVSHDLFHDSGRYGKGETGIASSIGIYSRVDSYEFAAKVHKRAAGIAGIEGCVGLNERLYAHLPVSAVLSEASCLCAHYSCSNSGVEAERIADGKNPFAYFYGLGVAECDGRQPRRVYFYQGEVCGFVSAYYACLVGGIVVQKHFKLVRFIHYMVVGYYIAVG